MGAHRAGQARSRRKPLTLRKKIVRAVVIVLVIFTGLIILGNLLPAHKAASPPAQGVKAVSYAYSVNVSPPGPGAPFVTSKAHVTALVKTGTDGVKSLLLVNSGTGPASAVIPLDQLGIAAAHVTVHNVWTGHDAQVAGIKVTLAPGGTALYSLK